VPLTVLLNRTQTRKFSYTESYEGPYSVGRRGLEPLTPCASCRKNLFVAVRRGPCTCSDLERLFATVRSRSAPVAPLAVKLAVKPSRRTRSDESSRVSIQRAPIVPARRAAARAAGTSSSEGPAGRRLLPFDEIGERPPTAKADSRGALQAPAEERVCDSLTGCLRRSC
jgi:hypothetical protein